MGPGLSSMRGITAAGIRRQYLKVMPNSVFAGTIPKTGACMVSLCHRKQGLLSHSFTTLRAEEPGSLSEHCTFRIVPGSAQHCALC